MAYNIYSKAGTDEAISSALADSLPDLTDYVQTTDTRLGDARTPTAHAASHKTAGADALTAADIGAQPAGSYAAAGHTHAPTDIGAATAAQGALADATTVEQVTLTANLAYALPAGTPAGVVHRVVFTQNGTGGHTVTYGGQPVTVDLTAGASTTVELHPVGAGHAIRYPVTNLDAQVSALAEDGGSALGASLSSTYETRTHTAQAELRFTPHVLTNLADVNEPVVKEDTTVSSVTFVADPCAVVEDGKVFLFYEAIGAGAAQVWVSESTDGSTFTNHRQAFALTAEVPRAAYPQPFKVGHTWYMTVDLSGSALPYAPILTTTEALFPLGWTFVKYAVTNDQTYDAVGIKDAAITRHNGLWWMQYVGQSALSPDHQLCYAYADDIEGHWTKVPWNPVHFTPNWTVTGNWNSGGGGWLNSDCNLYHFQTWDNQSIVLSEVEHLATDGIRLRTAEKELITISVRPAYLTVSAQKAHTFCPVWFNDQWHIYYDLIPSGTEWKIRHATAGGVA